MKRDRKIELEAFIYYIYKFHEFRNFCFILSNQDSPWHIIYIWQVIDGMNFDSLSGAVHCKGKLNVHDITVKLLVPDFLTW